ncbi:MAG: phosphoribosylformylglycinamidine synthase subunit PurQ [Chthoniobacteraceae bacterium]|nr:phosphoribosylformylglycinamidine synthase subunit PurQ [Chthoniobacteraceae bacterium]
MKAAVIRFPGSNCDQDCHYALQRVFGVPTDYVWHKESSLKGYDLVVLPGGFSYGDYLRCGAIARFSPIMKAVVDYAENGGLLIGICNGFQVLTESRLLPGALVRNRDLHFICEHRFLRVGACDNPFLNQAKPGQVLNIPIAHGEGNYTADEATLEELNANRQILVRYCDAQGVVSEAANPNGSLNNIAGICNAKRNVFGLMPHPERACEARLGSEDGNVIFQSILNHLGVRAVA